MCYFGVGQAGVRLHAVECPPSAPSVRLFWTLIVGVVITGQCHKVCDTDSGLLVACPPLKGTHTHTQTDTQTHTQTHRHTDTHTHSVLWKKVMCVNVCVGNSV